MYRLPRVLVFILSLWFVSVPAPAGEADPTLTALDAAGLQAILEDQAGQVVLLNFWATWCRPCLEEIPALRSLSRRYAADGFVLVPVSLDEADSAAVVVQPFIDRWFAGFDTWLNAETEMDDLVRVVDPAWNEVLPTSYLIGRNGEVVQRLQGGKPIDEFEAAILKALRP